MEFREKTVWVTGAASGIGKALSIEYARLGATIILSDRDKEKLHETANKCRELGVKAHIAPFDLEDSMAIEQTVADVLNIFPKIDILINSGGISQRSFAAETPILIDRKILETNFFGAIILTKLLLPSLISEGGGKIVVISSVVGKFGFPMRTAYSASKHALQGFFEALRAELYQHKVSVTIISPGRVQTNISLNAIDKEGKKHGIMDKGQAEGMPVDKCARKIIKAVYSNKKELLVGGKEVFMVYIRKYFPSLFHKLARKIKPM